MLGRVMSSMMSVLAVAQVAGLMLSGSITQAIGIRRSYFATSGLVMLIALAGWRAVEQRKRQIAASPAPDGALGAWHSLHPQAFAANCVLVQWIMATKEHLPEHDFRFYRRGNTGRIAVSNNLGYTMAEYDEKMGLTAWHRLVPAGKREEVEKWLLANYPIKADAPVVKPKSRAKAA